MFANFEIGTLTGAEASVAGMTLRTLPGRGWSEVINGGEALDCGDAVRRPRIPHELRGRSGALRDADRAPAPRPVRAPVLRQDADARWRHPGHHQRRVRLP